MTNRIDDIKAKWAAAGPCDWQCGEGYEQGDPGAYVYDKSTSLVVCSEDTGPSPEHARVIADAPADVAWLVAEVERLSTKVEALEGVNRDQAVAIGKLAEDLAKQRDFAADCARADKAMGRVLIEKRDEAEARATYWKAKCAALDAWHEHDEEQRNRSAEVVVEAYAAKAEGLDNVADVALAALRGLGAEP